MADMVASHIGNLTSQWWVLMITLALWSTATVFIFRGAFLGSPGHRKPRLLLGFTTSLLCVWYILDLFDIVTPETAATMIRGTGWVLASSLAWTAWTGVKYGQKVEAAAKVLEQALRKDDDE